MKLTIILLTAAIVNVSAKGLSQTVSFNGQNIPLREVMSVVKKQTGFSTIYHTGLLNKANPVSLNVKDMPLKDFLDQVFKYQSLDFSIMGTTIFVSPKPPMSNESISAINTALLPIRGKVLDSLGNPLVGATITIQKPKGTDAKRKTSNSTITSSDGSFSINVTEGEILLVSYIGYETRSVIITASLISSGNDLTIVLQPSIAKLEDVEVTVNTGYQNIPKERATGSFVTIDNNLLNRRVSTNVLDRLEGIASGVLFNKNNPEGSPSLSIRGLSTIFANNQPLVIIDNFPYNGDVNNINPNDIESITILKDAAAASIWGVQSGNGVIVITTKKGRSRQAMEVELNSNITFSKKPDLFYNRNFLPSTDFIDVEKELFAQGFYDGDLLASDPNDPFAYYPPMSPVVDILEKLRNNEITGADADMQINTLRNFDIRKYLTEHFYRNAFNLQNAINLRGGGNKSNFFFSAGYDRNLANQRGNKFDRITINSVNTFTPVKNLEVSGGVNFIQTNTENDNTLSQLSTGGLYSSKVIYPYAQLSDNNGAPLSIVKDYRSIYVNAAPNANYLPWDFKPLQELNNSWNTNKVKLYDIRITAGVKYTLLRNLSVEVKYQYQKTISDDNTLYDQESYYTRNLINRYSILSSGVVTGYNIPIGAILYTNNSNLTSNAGRAQLNYQGSWNKHELNAIAGTEIRETSSENNLNTLFGYDKELGTSQHINPLNPFTLNPSGFDFIPYIVNNGGTLDRFRSYFANVAYTFDKRYTFSASGRIDQSNLFGIRTNQKTVPLWSAGVLWSIDNESFYHVWWLPVLKFKATYGFNGNIDKSVAAYTVANYFSSVDLTGKPYTFGIVQFPGNDKLRWEKIRITNFALNFGSKNNRINGSVEFYFKKGLDIFGDAAAAPTSGYTTLRGNFAEIKGSGMDITINSLNINRRFKWNTTLLFSTTKDEVVKYTGTTLGIDLLEGRPVYGIYSVKWGGLDSANGDPRGYLAGELSKSYNTITSMPLKDKVFSGAALPTVFGSLRNDFSYHSFFLSVNFSFKGGYYFRKTSIQYNTLFYNWLGNIDYEKRWQQPGDEKITNVPSFPSDIYSDVGARDAFYRNSEILVAKGDHIRLQDIQLGYTFDKVNRLPFARLQLYAYINNLGIIWRANNDNIDPDYQTMQPPKTFSVGVKATF